MDKKSCFNCLRSVKCPLGCKDYSRWLRNPRKWLSILPEEPGWYWFRKVFHVVGIMLDPEILQVEENNKILEIYKNEKWKPLEEYHGVWQGPIRPEGK